ncbi:hypothetical protein OESDEN_18670 [Oesophagostomum dentatum]|uniref:S-adenosylmethionine-dependent methyltransferase Rv2258c-like winged HTH domain-containing protein n=1 Tax=Oesophagostomum dentatum TaxID=61180 RepID=A0A0B1SDS4_OESDE|nr:hypothetical protein OESDEN_18670 [Oesophagostomum dentatum]
MTFDISLFTLYILEMQIRIDGLISAAIAVGNRLKLFDALAKVGSEENPASAAQVAKEADCKERYVKEWLAAMATGDIIRVTKDEKFYIEKDRVEVSCFFVFLLSITNLAKATICVKPLPLDFFC